MSEFIGARISLISKSDIRYVGKLHNINSEDSTVALENVRSFGTEGRKAAQGNPEDEIAASDGVYEYIVFRGSDVKDLRVEEDPVEPAPAPQVFNDPAILSGSRPTPQNLPPQQQNFQQPPQHNQGPPFQPQQYPHYQQQYGQPPNQRFQGPPNGGPGFHGPPPPGYGHPGGSQGMQVGAPPPGWYPPPGQGYPHPPPPGPFSPAHDPRMPHAPPGEQNNIHMPPKPEQSQNNNGPLKPQNVNKASGAPTSRPQSKCATPGPTPAANQAAQISMESKTEPPATQATKQVLKPPQSKVALPMASVAAKSVAKSAQAQTAAKGTIAAPGSNAAHANAQRQYQDAARAATAAVAAAMAKLPAGPSAPTGSGGAVDNLTQKVNEMRVDNRERNPRGGRGRGRGDFERGRGGFRGGRGGREAQGKGLEVPATDFDFESANAKFNKEDLVKEVIASGEPITATEALNGTTNGAGLNGDGAKDEDEVVIPPAPVAYNKSSFFDNISSEAKDREEGSTARRPSGGDFRSEERKRNMETFGLGSVDGGGYRGFGRGRGRGRGFRGGPGGFRGGPRGAFRGRGSIEA